MTEAAYCAFEAEVSLIDFAVPASAADLTVIDRCAGPVLDLGCGPARMVRAINARGMHAVGVDIADGALAYARARGAAVLRRDVFARLPGEGLWASVVLLDGNIGIGGDPTRLLSRCAALLRPGGRVLVEVDAAADLDARGTLTVIDVDKDVHELPWSAVGSTVLATYALTAGFAVTESWQCAARHFVVLESRARGGLAVQG